MFGTHLSIAGGLHNALIQANDFNIECLQIFTSNQRQWPVKPLTSDQIELWQHHLRETEVKQVVSHDSYLINLASGQRELREKSIRHFINELKRCQILDIPYLVAHPGAHMGDGEAMGLKRVGSALNRIHKATAGYKTTICLEITAGQGTGLGHTFEQLRKIIDIVSCPERVAICFDTAHGLAAGYDLTSKKGALAVLDEFDDVIGLDLIKVIHVNDSKVRRGSRVDRHEHIGYGHVSCDAFKVIVNHRKFRCVPKILETPKGIAPDGQPWDLVNLETLRKMIKTSRRKKNT